MVEVWIRIVGAVILLCIGGYAEAEDLPKSAVEVEQRYPLGKNFSAWDILNATIVAEEGRALLNATLNDFPSARLQHVYAMAQADWKSHDRTYFICGEINAKNRLGAYTGWTHFVIAGVNGADKMPSLYFENQLDGAALWPMYCTRGRDQRFLRNSTADYAKMLITGKSAYDLPAQR